MEFKPDFIHYVAGADAYQYDTLGGLSLSKAAMAFRDEIVIQACQQAAIPMVATLAGGYAAKTSDVVDIHFQLAAQIYKIRCSDSRNDSNM